MKTYHCGREYSSHSRAEGISQVTARGTERGTAQGIAQGTAPDTLGGRHISTQPNSESSYKSEPPQSKVSRHPCQIWVVVGHCAFNVGVCDQKIIQLPSPTLEAPGPTTNQNDHGRLETFDWTGSNRNCSKFTDKFPNSPK